MDSKNRMDGCVCANGAKVAEIVHPYCPAHVPPEMEAELASLRAEVAMLAASTKYARIVAIVREWGGGGHGLPSRLRNNGDYTTAALVEALRGVIGGSDA